MRPGDRDLARDVLRDDLTGERFYVVMPDRFADGDRRDDRRDSTFAGESTEQDDFSGLDDLTTEDPRVVEGVREIVRPPRRAPARGRSATGRATRCAPGSGTGGGPDPPTRESTVRDGSWSSTSDAGARRRGYAERPRALARVIHTRTKEYGRP
ncbi:hypothetical protein [Umezawaea beigongshangensis]|uniref:hypothetical protein n=1 Tax=Umezawaea beigongshangensis TaxID=2780383 RepID=UPI0018F1B9E5|nr:hypothetical protein [Umezawaea beigongshangensis]